VSTTGPIKVLCRKRGTTNAVVALEAVPAVALEAIPAVALEAVPAVALEAIPAVALEAVPAVALEAAADIMGMVVQIMSAQACQVAQAQV